MAKGYPKNVGKLLKDYVPKARNRSQFLAWEQVVGVGLARMSGLEKINNFWVWAVAESDTVASEIRKLESQILRLLVGDGAARGRLFVRVGEVASDLPLQVIPRIELAKVEKHPDKGGISAACEVIDDESLRSTMVEFLAWSTPDN